MATAALRTSESLGGTFDGASDARDGSDKRAPRNHPPGDIHTGDGGHGRDDGDHPGGDGGHGGGGGGHDWVTVATFSVATAAHLARLKLENEGIACVLLDENLISTNWLLSPALGGIKLQVPAELLESAREVLTAGDVAPNGWEIAAAEQARCRTCGKGEYMARVPPMWLVLVSVLTFGLPLFFTSRHPVCDHCGAQMPE